MTEINQDTAPEAERVAYDLGFHVVGTLSPEEVTTAVSEIRALIESNGGVVLGEEAPRHIRLAYTMYRSSWGKREDFDSAHFGVFIFEATKEAVGTIEAAIKAYPNVFRYLLLKTDAENALFLMKERELFGESEVAEDSTEEVEALPVEEAVAEVKEDEVS
jgi:ribosomal protein S6